MMSFLPEPQLLAYHIGIQVSPLIITDHPPQPFVVYLHFATFCKSHWICQGKEETKRSTESAQGCKMSFPNQASFFSCHGRRRKLLRAWEGTDWSQIFIHVFYAMRRGRSADCCKGKRVLALFLSVINHNVRILNKTEALFLLDFSMFIYYICIARHSTFLMNEMKRLHWKERVPR